MFLIPKEFWIIMKSMISKNISITIMFSYILGTSSFNMERRREVAFETFKSNLEDLTRSQNRKTIEKQACREEQALEKLASENLVPGTIRVRYHNGQRYVTRIFN